MSDWWYLELSEHSPIAIVFAEWVPVMITITLGGLFATVIFPRWQDRYLSKKIRSERKIKITEEISELLNAYTNVWRRLIEISRYEKNLIEHEHDTKDVTKMKTQFVEQRSDIHDRLMGCLSRAKVFVSASQRREISKFIQWTESTSTLTLDELPEISEWRTWEERILSSLQGN